MKVSTVPIKNTLEFFFSSEITQKCRNKRKRSCLSYEFESRKQSLKNLLFDQFLCYFFKNFPFKVVYNLKSDTV